MNLFFVLFTLFIIGIMIRLHCKEKNKIFLCIWFVPFNLKEQILNNKICYICKTVCTDYFLLPFSRAFSSTPILNPGADLFCDLALVAQLLLRRSWFFTFLDVWLFSLGGCLCRSPIKILANPRLQCEPIETIHQNRRRKNSLCQFE